MFSMKLASIDDLDSVFQLSNEPLVRAVSINSSPISYDNHVSWFSKIIHDENVLFLLFYEDYNLVAQVRYKQTLFNEVEVSISVSGKYRGKGIASNILEMSYTELRARWDIEAIIAVVKSENVVSLGFFRKNGYVDQAKQTIQGIDCIVLKLIFVRDNK